GRPGTSVVLRRRVRTMFAVPGVRSPVDGTETELFPPSKPEAVPAKPGKPRATRNSVPMFPLAESFMTVPEVSFMCQRATTCALGLSCTKRLGREVARAEPEAFAAVTVTRRVVLT